MNPFRRRRPGEAEDEVATGEPAGAGAGPGGPAAARPGPRDASEVESRGSRIDLGALWLPGRTGMELRLELEEATKRVTAANVAMAGSSVQVQVFAAPRTEGIWDEIRSDIAAAVTRQGGTADEIVGTLGSELLARVPARTADGRTGHRVQRFAGVDGPRWFVRAVFSGPAAFEPEAAAALEEVLADTVVVRGGEAMAPRELLPLKLPTTGAGAITPVPGESADQPAGAPPRPRLELPERGPEITETR